MDPIVIALVLLAAVLAVTLVIAVRRRRRAQELQAQARHEEQVRQNLARLARDVQWNPSVRRLRAGNQNREEDSPGARR